MTLAASSHVFLIRLAALVIVAAFTPAAFAGTA
jgi:hypothetical protein